MFSYKEGEYVRGVMQLPPGMPGMPGMPGLSVMCDAFIKKSGLNCPRLAKYKSQDGKCYCGYHKMHLAGSSETAQSVELSQSAQTAQTAQTSHKHTTLPTDLPQKQKEVRSLLKWIFQALCHVYIEFGVILFLIGGLYITHYFLKYYYYRYCDGNLLRVWFFKQSKVCVNLNDAIGFIETWSGTNINKICEYVMAMVQNSTYFTVAAELFKNAVATR